MMQRFYLLVLLVLPLFGGAVWAEGAAANPASNAAPVIAPVDAALLQQWQTDKSTFTLIDARSAEEFATGHVEGALNITIDQAKGDNSVLTADKSARVLVYCRSGRRAVALAEFMQSLGYDNVSAVPSSQLRHGEGKIEFLLPDTEHAH